MTQLLLAVCLLLSAQMAKAPVDALDGLDPVLLIQGKEGPGKPALSVQRGGFTYLFSTPDTKATFEREPARYEIQLGGICARMGKTAGGNPSDFLVHDGKIYIFGSDECHKRFQASPAKYLEPAAAPFPATATASARGSQLLDRAVRAIGPAAKIDALTSYVEAFEQIQKRPQGDVPVVMKTMWRFPDRTRQERTMTLQGKTVTAATVLSPDGMWFLSGSGQAHPTAPAARPSLERDFGRHPLALLRARHAAGFKAAALDPATVDGATLQRVRVVYRTIDEIIGLDAQGRLHSVTFQDRNQEGEYGTYTLTYADYRTIDGLSLPFAVRGLFNGQPDPSQTWTVTEVQMNVPLEPALFAPPADGAK